MSRREPDPIRRRRTDAAGRRAERLAVLWLALKGYRILACRYQVAGGELDIVARRGDTLAIVEVKARETLEAAHTAVTATKRRRVERATAVWLSQHPWATRFNLRGDLVLIVPWHWPRHIVAALRLRV
jgi:putative endonuclease